MSPVRQASAAKAAERALKRPHVAEWFGHRVFPGVSRGGVPVQDQQSQHCPFLTETLQVTTKCVKDERARGVCTISAGSNGIRQDWLVCPYRALNDDLLADMVRRLYGIPQEDAVLIRPVPALGTDAGKSEILSAVSGSERVFVCFQDKLGGEISLSKTYASPELSFDITVVELLAGSDGAASLELFEPDVHLGKYGVIELQTTDTHGSYRQAVEALTNALDLHKARFPEMLALAENAEWTGRKVEGPNISNVSSAPSIRSSSSSR